MKLLSAIAFTLLLMQNPADTTAPAMLEGIVVSFGTNVPVANADVELRRTAVPVTLTAAQFDLLRSGGALPPGTALPAGIQAPPTFKTAGDGKFSFKNVPPGEYRVYATRGTSFIPGEYGQRSPSGTGIPITLAPGQTASNIRVSMTPSATISGRIVDADGDPVADARVNALRVAYQDGERMLLNARAALTDDRGEYRMSGLPPGQYYVASRPFEGRSTRTYGVAATSRFGGAQGADAPLVTLRTTDSGAVVEETWRSIFYPSAPDARSASPVSLRPGENMRGIDINLGGSETPAWRVRGIAVNGDTGLPATGVTVRLLPRGQLTPSVLMPSASTDRSGAFDVAGVLSGSYSMVLDGPQGLSGYMPLNVGNSNVEGLQVVVAKGVDIPYTVTVQGGAVDPALIGRLRLILDRRPVVAGQPTGAVVTTAGWPGLPTSSVSPQTAPASNGGFVMRAVPAGEFTVKVAGMPQGSYLKSITMGRADVLSDGLRVSTEITNPLEIVLASDSGTVSGRVIDQNREAVPSVTAVLIPDPARRSRMDLYRSSATDTGGRFRFQGIAPGEYKLFAWEDVVDGAWFDAEFLQNWENVGIAVRIGSGNNDPAEVKVIPWNNANGGQ